SLYTPPNGWFHQHFNTGREPARHIAIREGSRVTGPGFGYLGRQHADDNWNPVRTGTEDGGTLITHEAEDPEIRRAYLEALCQKGIEPVASEAAYRPRSPEAPVVH